MRRADKELDPTMSRIIKETADEEQVLTSQMKEAYLIYMELNVKKWRQFITTVIPNFGRFFLSPWKTNKVIRNMFLSWRKTLRGEPGMTRDEIRERLKVYYPLHQIARTHFIRNGGGWRRRQRRKAKRNAEILRQDGNQSEL